MPNVFHQPLIITQGYGPTDFASEPAWASFAHFHRGIDAVPTDPKQWGVGVPIFALIAGTVWHVGSYEDRAIHVIVKHDDGTWGCYWHLDSYQVSTGQRVTPDTQLGRMGTSGNSTKPHIHFEWLAAGPWKGMLSMKPIDSTALFSNTTTPATGPGKDDVTNEQFIRLVAKVAQGIDNYPKEALDNWLNGLATGKTPEELLKTFLMEGDQYLSQHDAIATYWRAKGGADPDKYADERLGGGATIASVLNSDLPADEGKFSNAQARLQLALDQKEATDAALIAATKNQGALQAQVAALTDELTKLKETGGMVIEMTVKGMRLLGNYLLRRAKDEEKALKGGDSK